MVIPSPLKYMSLPAFILKSPESALRKEPQPGLTCRLHLHSVHLTFAGQKVVSDRVRKCPPLAWTVSFGRPPLPNFKRKRVCWGLGGQVGGQWGAGREKQERPRARNPVWQWVGKQDAPTFPHLRLLQEDSPTAALAKDDGNDTKGALVQHLAVCRALSHLSCTSQMPWEVIWAGVMPILQMKNRGWGRSDDLSKFLWPGKSRAQTEKQEALRQTVCFHAAAHKGRAGVRKAQPLSISFPVHWERNVLPTGCWTSPHDKNTVQRLGNCPWRVPGGWKTPAWLE